MKAVIDLKANNRVFFVCANGENARLRIVVIVLLFRNACYLVVLRASTRDIVNRFKTLAGFALWFQNAGVI